MGKQKNRNNKKENKAGKPYLSPGRQPTWPGPPSSLSSSPSTPEQAARRRGEHAAAAVPSRPPPRLSLRHDDAPVRLHLSPPLPVHPSPLSPFSAQVRSSPSGTPARNRGHRQAQATPPCPEGLATS